MLKHLWDFSEWVFIYLRSIGQSNDAHAPSSLMSGFPCPPPLFMCHFPRSGVTWLGVTRTSPAFKGKRDVSSSSECICGPVHVRWRSLHRLSTLLILFPLRGVIYREIPEHRDVDGGFHAANPLRQAPLPGAISNTDAYLLKNFGQNS